MIASQFAFNSDRSFTAFLPNDYSNPILFVRLNGLRECAPFRIAV